jgi:hypothetical protein
MAPSSQNGSHVKLQKQQQLEIDRTVRAADTGDKTALLPVLLDANSVGAYAQMYEDSN